MKNKALVVIDLQNDITKNYKKIIGKVNKGNRLGSDERYACHLYQALQQGL